MPLYEFRCESCGHEIETILAFSDPLPTTCDACGGTLKKLLADIETRQTIKHILGHSDIAPGRKSDPWGFNWKKIGGKDL